MEDKYLAKVEEWMNRSYPVVIKKLTQDEGGGFLATIPLLGEYGFSADGETEKEALNNLEWVKRQMFLHLVVKGWEPLAVPDERCN